MLLNPLPIQTWQRDEDTRDLTNDRIKAFKVRMVDRAHVKGLQGSPQDEEQGIALPMTPVRRPSVTFAASQEWEGYVTAVGENTFLADLVDITRNKRIETDAVEFLLSDLSTEDRDLLEEGSVFRWVVGYQRLRGGTRQRVSQIYFRRMSRPSANHLKSIALKADELATTLGFE